VLLYTCSHFSTGHMERINVKERIDLGYVEVSGERLGRVAGLDLYLETEQDTIYITVLHLDRSYRRLAKRAMILMLVPDPDYEGSYTIDMVWVDREYKGMNLAPRVYRKLLKTMNNLLLRAGATQSPGGRYIWYSLAQYRDIFMYATTPSGRIHDIEVDHVTRELELDHADLYDNQRTEYAVFACAGR
jgi:hypothetical protein